MVGFGMRKEKDVIWKTKNSFNCLINAGENKLVQAGRKAMKRGALKPRFLIWDILIPKADLDKI